MKEAYISNFVEIMDIWDTWLETKGHKAKISSIIDNNELILFFKKNNKIYGAPEESRLIFAKIKNKDKDIPPSASFAAYDLEQAAKGKETMQIFSKKDLEGIKVIQREKAERLIYKKSKNTITFKDKDATPGIINLKDE